MAVGYLYIETRPDRPRTVRVRVGSSPPATGRGTTSAATVRYVARFDDLDAGRMHLQNTLCRSLIDIDAGTYRVSLAEAIAAVESDNLAHRRVWIDPELSDEALGEIEERTARRRMELYRADRAWYAVGVAFAVLLFLQLLGLL